MQLLTNLLLTVLVKRVAGKPVRPENESLSPLLRMKHPIRTSHLMPGRVRFHTPVLIDRATDAKRVGDAVSRIQGVHEVGTDARTGSVLILFEEDRLSAEILFAALIRLLDLEKELNKPPVSLLRREGKHALHSLDRALYDTTQGLLDLWSLAGILAGAAAVNKFVLSQLSLPGLLISAWMLSKTKK